MDIVRPGNSADVGRRMRRLIAVGTALALVATAARGDSGTGAPAKQAGLATDQWAVKLAAGVDPETVAAMVGATDVQAVGQLARTYVLSIPRDPRRGTDMDAELARQPEVEWSARQTARQQSKKMVPTDPFFSSQWHLRNLGQSGGTAGQDINVVPVWTGTPAYTGAGVVIGVVDDGLEHTHPDIIQNYLRGPSRDFNDNDSNPAPNRQFDTHGTSVAGVAAAANDGSSCGVGVAFDANLAGLRLIAEPSTDAQEASALTHAQGTIDVYNNSWGPPDIGVVHTAGSTYAIGPLAQQALANGAANGRGGRGSVYVWSAGNGREFNDNVNYDPYANSRYTIAVGAVDDDGVQASYSEPGAAMLVTAPSSSAGKGQVVTTDLTGTAGGNAITLTNDCRDDFGGTSSSTPVVAGVVALMLQANPNLGWRDVQHILARTAVKNNPGDAGWSTNGAGFHINHRYGFGRVDAQAAVNTARNWTNVAAAMQATRSKGVAASIPDNNSSGVSSTLQVDQNLTLEHVEVVLNATHSYRGDLRVVLTSPSGTRSVLAESRFEDGGSGYSNWRFMSVRHWGELSAGQWHLQVVDGLGEDVGTFDSWQLMLHGTAAPPTLKGVSTVSQAVSGAKFFGGATADGGASYGTQFSRSQVIDVVGTINVEPTDVGGIGRIYVVVVYNGALYYQTAQGTFLRWGGALQGLDSVAGPRALRAQEALTVVRGLSGLPGTFQVFLAYQDAGGDIHYAGTPISFTVSP